jgi:hypothetical protein
MRGGSSRHDFMNCFKGSPFKFKAWASFLQLAAIAWRFCSAVILDGGAWGFFSGGLLSWAWTGKQTNMTHNKPRNLCAPRLIEGSMSRQHNRTTALPSENSGLQRPPSHLVSGTRQTFAALSRHFGPETGLERSLSLNRRAGLRLHKRRHQGELPTSGQ